MSNIPSNVRGRIGSEDCKLMMGGSLAGVMNRGPSRPVLTPVKPVNHDIEGAAFMSLVILLVRTPLIRSDVYGVVSRGLST